MGWAITEIRSKQASKQANEVDPYQEKKELGFTFSKNICSNKQNILLRYTKKPMQHANIQSSVKIELVNFLLANWTHFLIFFKLFSFSFENLVLLENKLKKQH